MTATVGYSTMLPGLHDHDAVPRQALLLHADFAAAIASCLEVGAATEVFYCVGREHAVDGFRDFCTGLESTHDRAIEELAFTLVAHAWLWQFRQCGFGSWTVDLSRADDGLVVCEGTAPSLDAVSGPPIRAFVAGMLAGFFSSLAQRELRAIDVARYSIEKTSPGAWRIAVGGPQHTKDVLAHIESGASFDEATGGSHDR
ncbi:MAG: hypothetical protein H6832_14685 [Planctomycetes bacterium]|nr:hypothetical protein [Planctomycetota bacterium]